MRRFLDRIRIKANVRFMVRFPDRVRVSIRASVQFPGKVTVKVRFR